MRRFLGIVLAVIVAIVVVKVSGNLLSHGSPPASCQLLGGQWSLWSGWRCG